MNSRYDVLTHPADRRRLALFRSSGAAAAVLFLFALNGVPSSHGGVREAVRGDLFALEVGVPEATAMAPHTVAATPEPLRAASIARRVDADEFAFSTQYPAEPIGY